MRFVVPPEPLTEDDAAIAAALADVDPVPLLAAVAHATGDLTLLRDDLRPTMERMLEPDAGLTPEQVAQARALAAAALARLRDAGGALAPPPDDAALRRMIDFVTCGAAEDSHLPVLTEELALGGADLRAPEWHKADVAPDRPFLVAIVGAGMSGIAAGHRLGQAGVDYVVLEKNDDVGGTWYENRYPGCRVDVPSNYYCYSFMQTPDWPQHYATQPVLLDYFRECAAELGVRDHIRFRTEVRSADWDDAAQVWHLRLRTPDGEEQLDAHALVSAVGQLNRPQLPDIPGRDTFAGPAFHSAAWRTEVDLTGLRVAIIGTGASAAQFIPRVAEQAGALTVFQRTPPWMLPTPEYTSDVEPGIRWAARHLPDLMRWERLWIYWRTQEGLLPMAMAEEGWEGGEESVGTLNDFIRVIFTDYLRGLIEDDVLFEQILPRYPPLAKRFVRDDGTYATTLQRPNVELVTTPIREITESGVVTDDNVTREFDVVIYGTGFSASQFLTPMQVRGTGGEDLHELWDGEARAYLGVTVPRMPNLFLMYGPNTNIVVNGSIIFFSECETRYLVECVHLLLQTGHTSLEVRKDVHDAYNARIDDANSRMAWGVSSVRSWYKSATGRISQNWPFSLQEFWTRTLAPDPDDYVLT